MKPGTAWRIARLCALAALPGPHAPAPAQADGKAMIFWLDYLGTVYSANADGSERHILASGGAQGLDGPDGVAVDTKSGKVHWSNMAEGRATGSLQRTNLDGTDIEYVVRPVGTHTPKQIQLDAIHGKIYWSDRYAGTVNRASMQMPAGRTAADRRDIDTLLSGLTRPIDLALDIPHGKIYWTDRDEGTIHRAGMEIPAGQKAGKRGDVETLVRGLSTPIGISLDLAGSEIYYTELIGQVGRAHLDGSHVETLWKKAGGASFTGITYVMIPSAPGAIGQSGRTKHAGYHAAEPARERLRDASGQSLRRRRTRGFPS